MEGSKAPDEGWLKKLVEELQEDHHSEESKLHPSNKDWEPQGNMPRAYDWGLERSKLVMRAYVYGSRVGDDRPAPDPGSADGSSNGEGGRHLNRDARNSPGDT